MILPCTFFNPMIVEEHEIIEIITTIPIPIEILEHLDELETTGMFSSSGAISFIAEVLPLIIE